MLARRYCFTPDTSFSPIGRVNTSSFSILIAPSKTFGVCVSISKKKAPTAVLRNTLKRQIHGVLQAVYGERPQGKYQYIISAREKFEHKATQLQLSQLEQKLEELKEN